MTWKKIKLDEIISLTKGKKLNETFFPGAYRYIQIEDLHGTGTQKYTNDIGVSCQNSDILIAWDGANAGKVGSGISGMIGSTIAKITVNSEDVSSKYLYWFLSSKFELIKSKRTGATIPHVNGSELRSMKVPLPPLHIQEQIADTLDKADALRRKDQELLQKYDELAQSIFYDMFGDPVRNERGWDKCTIRDIVTDVKYGTPSPAEEYGAYPYLRMNNITYGGKLDLTDLKYISVSEKDYQKFGTQKGDLLFNRTNSKDLVGKTTVVDTCHPMVIAGYLIRVRFSEKANPWYISSYLNSDHGKSTLKALCKSIIGMANINAQELQDIKILLPPKTLQEDFYKKLKALHKQTSVVQNSSVLSERLTDLNLSRFFS
jgi:type I restriction enzyme S subunit